MVGKLLGHRKVQMTTRYAQSTMVISVWLLNAPHSPDSDYGGRTFLTFMPHSALLAAELNDCWRINEGFMVIVN